MMLGACHLAQTFCIGDIDWATRSFGARNDIAQTPSLPSRHDIQGADRLRPLSETGNHRVKAMESSGGRHGHSKEPKMRDWRQCNLCTAIEPRTPTRLSPPTP